jgi:hypothetical protein
MKKFILLCFLVLTAQAQAQHRHYHHHHYHNSHRGNNWLAPAIIGGVVGYGLSRYYYEPTYTYSYVPSNWVYVQQPVVPQTVCGPWIETQYSDGSITRTRTCQ